MSTQEKIAKLIQVGTAMQSILGEKDYGSVILRCLRDIEVDELRTVLHHMTVAGIKFKVRTGYSRNYEAHIEFGNASISVNSKSGSRENAEVDITAELLGK